MKKVNTIFSSKTFFALVTTFIQIFLWVGLVYIVNFFLISVGLPTGTGEKDTQAYNYVIALWLFLFSYIAGVIVCIRVLMKTEHPSYKLVWVLFIILIPSVGVFCYFFYGRHKIRKKMKDYYIKSSADIRRIIENSDYEKELKLSATRQSSNVSKFVLNTGHLPVYQDTHTNYYGDMNALWSQLLVDLMAARKSIYIEMFIIRGGVFWDSVKNILIEKSLSGVDVRVIYDDVGTSFDKQELKELTDTGIKVFAFNKLGITFDASKNNRTHRKMVIIDGETAFTGGFNIADEYVGKLIRHGVWKDSGMRFEGPGVYSFTIMFLSFWQLQKDVKPLDAGNSYAPDPSCYHTEYHGYVQPLSSGPLNNYRLIEYAFMQLISSAKEYIYITTPYLILDTEMETALCLAAQSGIDVRIIMPGIPDKKLIFGVSRSFYPNLLKAGVKIYEYSEGFVHSKEVIVDGRRAFLGTCNMDYRSFFLHFECGALLYDTASIIDMENAYLSLQEKCREVHLEWALSLKLRQRLWRSFARLFAPLF